MRLHFATPDEEALVAHFGVFPKIYAGERVFAALECSYKVRHIIHVWRLRDVLTRITWVWELRVRVRCACLSAPVVTQARGNDSHVDVVDRVEFGRALGTGPLGSQGCLHRRIKGRAIAVHTLWLNELL